MVKALVVLFALPIIFFFMGTFAYLGMGSGSSEFPSNPTWHDVLLHIQVTTGLGAVVTLGAALLFGFLQLILWMLSWLKSWVG